MGGQRESVWVQAWIAVANANDCKSPDIATKYADACLKAFDERFTNNRVSTAQ